MNQTMTRFLSLTSILLGLMTSSQLSLASDVPKVKIEEHREIRIVDSNSVEYSAAAGTDSQVDNLALLIAEAEKRHQLEHSTGEQETYIKSGDNYAVSTGEGIILSNLDFDQWLNMSPYRVNEVAQYQSYLAQYVGVYNVPPMNQLLTTARSWQECGHEPFQLPPRDIWSNMIKTLQLYSVLKSQGILPQSTVIRSVYRSPELNKCAGGSAGSKHMTNGAIDVWVPEYDEQPWYLNPMQDNLCYFWGTQGEAYDFGLGIYSTGAVHIDTQGYRRWGAQHTSMDSLCRLEN